MGEQLGALILDRDEELAALRDAILRARAGHGRVMVVLESAGGTGKSALVLSAAETARDAGVRVLSARGGEFEQDYPFGVIRQLFEPVLTHGDEHERATLLSGAAAPAAWMLGLSSDGSGAGAAGFAAMHAIYWLTVNLAARGPVILAVDDAHWADASSLRALDFLARRLTDTGAMLLLALRPEEPTPHAELLDELRTVPDALRLSPTALRGESVAELVRHRIPGASDALCRAFQEATAGNPLLVHELLRTFATEHDMPSPDAVLQASVPSLGDRVFRRVGRVDRDAQVLARAMAVIGDGGRIAVAASLAGIDGSDAGRIANGLRRIEVLSAEDPFAFVHPLVRRSMYDGIPLAERRDDHQRAAALLTADAAPPEAVAAHLQMLPPSRSSASAGLLVKAAERALDRAAPDEAVRWLRRALEENAPEPHRSELLVRLGLALTLLRDPESIPVLEEAYELAQDGGLRSQVAVALAYTLATAGAWEATAELVSRAERDIPGPDLAAVADLTAIKASLELYDPDRIQGFVQRRDHYAAVAADDHWGSHALAALLATDAAFGGRLEEARRYCDQALEGGRLLRERPAGGWAAPQLLGALIVLDDLGGGTVDATIGAVDAAGRASGSVVGMLTALATRGWLHGRRGDLPAADADLSTALTLARDAGMPMAIANVAYFLIDVMLERDGLGDTAALIDAIELEPAFLNTWSGAMLLEARGRLRIAGDQREAGIADLRAMGRTTIALGFGPAISTWRSALALALPAGAREEAMALAGEELSLAQATGLARPQGIALRALGLLDGSVEGIERLRESVALLEASPARLEEARSLVALGSALRRANRRTQARHPLMAGLELAYACGATRLYERAQQELLAAGGRRRRNSISDRDSLTSSELRVAKLAAGGAANAEIAQTLYVSLKTVETHLSRVYAKLGLAGSGSRARLVTALGTPEVEPS